MAQYYHVVNQNDKNTGEIHQFYQKVEENPSVQYVITPDDQQQQFQTQQVVVSSDQLMVVDGQPQRVILDRPQIAYQTSSYIIQKSLIDFPNRSQQLYYMPGTQAGTPVVVEQTPAPQPVVLNHQMLTQGQSTSTVNLMDEATPAETPCESNLTQLLQEQVPTPVVRNVMVQNKIRAPQINLLQQKNVLQTIQTLQKKNLKDEKVIKKDNEPQGNVDTVTLSDGSIMPFSHYRKLMALQKNKQRTERFDQSQLASPNNDSAVRKTRSPNITRNRVKQYFNPNELQRNFVQPPNRDNVIQDTTQNTNTTMQQSKANQNQYLIQSPKHHNTNKPLSLPSFLYTSQIQQIIENTPISEEYSDSVRMLVLLENKEQRLITFTLPKEACTIQEILDQINVPYTSDTPIHVTEANTNGINYIVTVGNVSLNDEDNQNQEINNDNKDGEEGSDGITEKSKLVEGQLAVCAYCGYLSEDFNRCSRCKTKLPENVKTITATDSLGKRLSEKKMNYNARHITQRKKVKSKLTDEIVVLSSDDENDCDKSGNKTMNDDLSEKFNVSANSSLISKEPTITDIQKNSLNNSKILNEKVENSGFGLSVLISCRTVRIGSYRFIPINEVRIDYSGLTIKVPHPKNAMTKILKISRTEIVKVLISFQKSLPVMFYYLLPSAGVTIRTALDMTKNSDYYYDPLSEEDETHRRITLLPDGFSEEVKLTIKKFYSPNGLLEELTPKEANDILMKTCPKELGKSLSNSFSGVPGEFKQLFTYPPEGKGRISISTEDYTCLGTEEFLNDVIIDFYLKYLFNHLSTEQQEKVHIFSSFFYNRLTTKPVKGSKKSQPFETDPNLTPAQKRHARVKNWTKNINIFEKDFIIVPLNENCHWFLAIICFPGLDGPQTFDGQPYKIEPKARRKPKIIGPTIPQAQPAEAEVKEKREKPIMCEDGEMSDKDEADGDDSELDSEEEEVPPTPVTNGERPKIKQPCILIFDSLAGASRSRVVATLRDYLTCEYKTKMEVEKVFTKDVIKGACPKVPQQTNFTDCGLYLLQYVENFFKEPINDYHIPIKQLKTWFEEITVTKKREDISLIIKSLMEKYGVDVALLPEVSFPTVNGELVERSRFKEDADEEEENEEKDQETGEITAKMDVTNSNVDSTTFDESHEETNSKTDESTSTKGDSDSIVNSLNWFKPDVSEVAKQRSKETLSYLKAKRIVRHKSTDNAGPDKKKLKGDAY